MKKKSNQKTTSFLNQKAFTLIEIMITMAIVAALVTMVASRFNAGKSEIKEHLTQLMVLSKKSFQYAQITNETYRIVFDLNSEDEEGRQKQHSYWVEKATGTQLLPSENQEEQEELDEEGKPKSAFQLAPRVLKKPKSLPEGYYFAAIDYGGREEITEGKAYLYFFPQGFTEESLVRIEHREETYGYSILINPLTGIADLINKKVGLKDLKQGK